LAERQALIGRLSRIARETDKVRVNKPSQNAAAVSPDGGGDDMTMKQRIADDLKRAFDPTTLEVIDESHLHAGHSGARPGGESHFRVHLVAPAFSGKGRLERHRMIYAALTQEIADGVHALALHARAPGEA
jgi:BolA family transcriptional regulator, general stress-responsive regulator